MVTLDSKVTLAGAEGKLLTQSQLQLLYLALKASAGLQLRRCMVTLLSVYGSQLCSAYRLCCVFLLIILSICSLSILFSC